MQNLRRVYKTTEGPPEDLKKDLSSSILVFLSRVSTTIFWRSVLEIIRTQSTNFVMRTSRNEKEEEEEEEKKKEENSQRAT